MSAHTPGPWRWELNESSKSLQLVGGFRQFDLTIIEPIRWGMSSATLFVRDTAHDDMNLLHKLHERRDWIAPFPGREHHADWCTGVKHPDLKLIEAAPDLLAALQALLPHVPGHLTDDLQGRPWIEQARAAITKATGGAA